MSIPNNQSSDPDDGMTCEIRQFESRLNAKGERVILRVGSKRTDLKPGRDPASRRSALLLTKFWDCDNNSYYTELEIQSPLMKQALKELVPEYKDINIEFMSIVIRDQPGCIFHHRADLLKYRSRCMSNGELEAGQHVQYLIDYMYSLLMTEMHTYKHFMENPALKPAIDFDNLWMVFKRGDLMYVQKRRNVGGTMLRFVKMEKTKPIIEKPRWRICGRAIDYNGTHFGHREVWHDVNHYDGVQPLEDLLVVPMKHHPDRDQISQKLLERGRKFANMHGSLYKSYSGVAELLSDRRNEGFDGEDDFFPTRSTLVNGRIMIDPSAFFEARPSHEPYLLSLEKKFEPGSKEHQEMSNEEYLICDDVVGGYSLSEKKWGLFKIDFIDEVALDTEAYSSLIFDQNYKDMIRSLLEVHAANATGFDDVIQGKGKGMVFLLHGAPGVGKTLTAESVSDHQKLPLFKLDVGSLGVTATQVEEALAAAFKLATRWKAVVLLDEADVFLEQRSSTDLERNCLISVFLRTLEYFQGVLFLTTNRIGSFDSAFKSRIHLAIHYPALDSKSRKALWKLFLSRACDSANQILVDNQLESLDDEGINGRQIKNVTRIAHALSVSEGTPITLKHLNVALDAMKAFEKDFEQARGTGGDVAEEPREHRKKRRRLE